MTRRELMVVAAVLVVLAAVAGWQRRPREAAPVGPVAVLPEGALAADAVVAIELAQAGPEGTAEGRLERRDGGWVLSSREDAPADPDRVARLLEALDGLVGEVRTEDPALLPEFQLVGDGVIRLEVSATDAAPIVLWIGKRGPRSNRSFVRPDGDDRAWLAHGPLHSALGIHGRGEAPLDPDHFLDLRLFRVEAEEVVGVSVEGEHVWALARDADGAAWRWEPTLEEAPPDDRGATGKAHAVARLRASALVGSTRVAEQGWDSPVARVQVSTAGGRERTMLVGALVPVAPAEAGEPPAEPEERFVKMVSEPRIWRVRTASLDALSRPLP